MSTSSWDDTITVISGWLPLDESEGKRGPDALVASKLSGFSLDSVERLLQRLTFEQAVTKRHSALRNERDLTLAYWQTMLAHGWIRWSQQRDEPAMIAVAAERAELALGRIVDWYNSGGYWPDNEYQEALPVTAFVSLVQEWLRMRNSEGTIRAIDLLMSWTEGEDAIELLGEFQNEVTGCLNQAMEQSTGLLLHTTHDEELNRSTTALANRLDLLRDAGWKGLQDTSTLASKTAAINIFESTEAEHANDEPDDDAAALRHVPAVIARLDALEATVRAGGQGVADAPR